MMFSLFLGCNLFNFSDMTDSTLVVPATSSARIVTTNAGGMQVAFVESNKEVLQSTINDVVDDEYQTDANQRLPDHLTQQPQQSYPPGIPVKSLPSCAYMTTVQQGCGQQASGTSLVSILKPISATQTHQEQHHSHHHHHYQPQQQCVPNKRRQINQNPQILSQLNVIDDPNTLYPHTLPHKSVTVDCDKRGPADFLARRNTLFANPSIVSSSIANMVATHSSKNIFCKMPIICLEVTNMRIAVDIMLRTHAFSVQACLFIKLYMSYVMQYTYFMNYQFYQSICCHIPNFLYHSWFPKTAEEKNQFHAYFVQMRSQIIADSNSRKIGMPFFGDAEMESDVLYCVNVTRSSSTLPTHVYFAYTLGELLSSKRWTLCEVFYTAGILASSLDTTPIFTSPLCDKPMENVRQQFCNEWSDHLSIITSVNEIAKSMSNALLSDEQASAGQMHRP